ncbi:membrane progestin receptor alpha-B-like isoform X2 [Mizuhopecten yessoensis]|uniref:Membrane progestin receptor alpha-B n=2 Tax=Mizuhopecten yessoensis TaxID=6573 RepID=A0A210QST2_MIZYE|nr:membrane progestin receptor alpha-B-like isoform X2 [Mizuhopecten yessoensis]OWF51794.1 Membrane progestin receptor alpha-B [Mizuhopecten yessoensis]
MGFFNFPSTVTSSDHGLTAVCNKHIHTGYRRPHQPWSYYVTSVFQANNQTFNVWTHLIGCLFIAQKACQLSLTFDFINDAESHPLGAGLISVFILLTGSSFAHWFCDRSDCVHYTCFFIDYSCVGIYAMGTTLVSHCFLVRDKQLAIFLAEWSSPVSVFLSLQVTIVFCWTKFHLGMQHKATKIVQLATVSAFYIWLLVPLLHRCLWPSYTEINLTLGLHKWHVLLAFINALIYVAHFPERWFPKTFDIIGNSHQLHHIVLVATANSFFNATLVEIDNLDAANRHLTSYMIEHLGTMWMSYGVVLSTFAANCIIIVLASLKVKCEETKPSR